MANANEIQILEIEARRKGWSKKKIPYQYGQKIRWEINATEITMCNKTKKTTNHYPIFATRIIVSST